jgi:hypothetical protein
MSELSYAPAASLPVVNQAREPGWVRHGSASTQRAYQEALAFEDVLVEQLTHSVGSGLGGEEAEGALGEEGSSASEPGLASMAPQALAGSIMGDGGLGLAAQLTQGLAGATGSATATGSVTDIGARTGAAAIDTATRTGAVAAPTEALP